MQIIKELQSNNRCCLVLITQNNRNEKTAYLKSKILPLPIPAEDIFNLMRLSWLEGV